MTQENSSFINLRILFLLLVGVCSLGMTTQAQSKQSFKVELIVFSQSPATSETFNGPSSPLQWPKELVELGGKTPLSQGQPFALLEASDLSLSRISTKLLNSKNYEPLFHIGWVESVPANRLGKGIHINRTVGDGVIDGYVQLKRSHYLHYFVVLEYRLQDSINDSLEYSVYEDNADVFDGISTSKTYRIDEKRRIHLNELHYFDHPRFGVIVKVSPL